jgi:hypothetical protein
MKQPELGTKLILLLANETIRGLDYSIVSIFIIFYYSLRQTVFIKTSNIVYF